MRLQGRGHGGAIGWFRGGQVKKVGQAETRHRVVRRQSVARHRAPIEDEPRTFGTDFEPNARQALEIADRGYVLVQGANRFTDTGQALLADPDVRRSFLGG